MAKHPANTSHIKKPPIPLTPDPERRRKMEKVESALRKFAGEGAVKAARKKQLESVLGPKKKRAQPAPRGPIRLRPKKRKGFTI